MSHRSNPAAPITPMVYVRDKTVWQYKRLTRNLSKDEAPGVEHPGQGGLGTYRNRHRSSHRALLFQAAQRLRENMWSKSPLRTFTLK